MTTAQRVAYSPLTRRFASLVKGLTILRKSQLNQCAGEAIFLTMTAMADYPNYAKIVVTFEPREDGGLRAYSDDVPGFVLSHANAQAVLQDVKPALEGILSHIYGAPVVVEQLSSLRKHLSGVKADASVYTPPPCQEYVGLIAA